MVRHARGIGKNRESRGRAIPLKSKGLFWRNPVIKWCRKGERNPTFSDHGAKIALLFRHTLGPSNSQGVRRTPCCRTDQRRSTNVRMTTNRPQSAGASCPLLTRNGHWTVASCSIKAHLKSIHEKWKFGDLTDRSSRHPKGGSVCAASEDGLGPTQPLGPARRASNLR